MSKTNVVKVIANKEGNALTVSPKNPEYGWVAVESIQPTFSEGFMRLGRRVAFIAGTVKDLQAFGFTVNQELPGKIVVKEGLEPLNAGDATIGIKYPNAAAKAQGLSCMVDDQPVYRKSFYTTNGEATDVLVAHNNGDRIRQFMAANNKPAAGIDPKARLAELKAIPAANRTAAQKEELLSLMEG